MFVINFLYVFFEIVEDFDDGWVGFDVEVNVIFSFYFVNVGVFGSFVGVDGWINIVLGYVVVGEVYVVSLGNEGRVVGVGLFFVISVFEVEFGLVVGVLVVVGGGDRVWCEGVNILCVGIGNNRFGFVGLEFENELILIFDFEGVSYIVIGIDFVEVNDFIRDFVDVFVVLNVFVMFGGFGGNDLEVGVLWVVVSSVGVIGVMNLFLGDMFGFFFVGVVEGFVIIFWVRVVVVFVFFFSRGGSRSGLGFGFGWRRGFYSCDGCFGRFGSGFRGCFSWFREGFVNGFEEGDIVFVFFMDVVVEVGMVGRVGSGGECIGEE